LGMHPDGYAILLPANGAELGHANSLVLPENEVLESQLVGLSLRKSVLSLVASRVVSNFGELTEFYHNTLFWHQTRDQNPRKLEQFEEQCLPAVQWLIENELMNDEGGTYLVTPLGYAAALSGLLPSTAVQLAEVLRTQNSALVENFETWEAGLIYCVCSTDEFCGDRPSRFLPYVRANHDSVTYWRGQNLLTPLQSSDTRLCQAAHAVVLYAEGIAERKIAFKTSVTSGVIHRLAVDVAWVIDGLHKISCVPDVCCPQLLSNEIALLARRVRWGAPSEALDIIRVAELHSVPGLGRQRAMALVQQGISTIHEILGSTKDALTRLLRNEQRVEALINAASSTVGLTPNRLAQSHIKLADELGLKRLVEACNSCLGTDYEEAVFGLLNQETSWGVTRLDDGNRQNVPDILLKQGDVSILIECKTCTKSPPLIKKEEAWAVLQKASDFEQRFHRVTLGKPEFDETSKKKVAASHDITLIEHPVFMEGVLRVISGNVGSDVFIAWLSTPGLSELERLAGSPTYSI